MDRCRRSEAGPDRKVRIDVGREALITAECLGDPVEVRGHSFGCGTRDDLSTTREPRGGVARNANARTRDEVGKRDRDAPDRGEVANLIAFAPVLDQRDVRARSRNRLGHPMPPSGAFVSDGIPGRCSSRNRQTAHLRARYARCAIADATHRQNADAESSGLDAKAAQIRVGPGTSLALSS